MNERMQRRLDERAAGHALRDVLPPSALLDFSSNDYLGLASSGELAARVAERLQSLSATGAARAHAVAGAGAGAGARAGAPARAGAGASRLLGGNYPLLDDLESHAAAFHGSEAALFFSTGYAAQSGLISTVAARGDLILYDALVHASAHEGMRLSPARRFPFAHNDPAALAACAETSGPLAPGAQVFVLVESIYSMDGDLAPLADLAALCKARGWNLIVDEAHAGGLAGPRGEGLVYALGLQDRVFARVITYGKAFGAAGGMVLGSALLRRYLINYCRAFIYSTGPLVSQVVTVQEAYALVAAADAARARIRALRRALVDGLAPRWHLPSGPPERDSPSAIVPIYCPGNEQVLALSAQLAAAGYDLKAVRAPTVAAGAERLRCCLHADQAGVGELISALASTDYL